MFQVIPVSEGLCVCHENECRLLPNATMDHLFTQVDPAAFLAKFFTDGTPSTLPAILPPPVGSQEIWAAGVTYFRSRVARMEESSNSGGDRFYDLVYEADRPELFFKATAPRVRGTGANIRIRSDSAWSVPEPELVLAINSAGIVFGYTIGNDVSSRDIEGENPLYLPQAKVYRGSCAMGPWLTVCAPLLPETGIAVEIERRGETVFSGNTTLAQLKRGPQELAEWLFRENEFPNGAWLFTGTGIVPPGTWTLLSGDLVRISIDGLGVLENAVE